MYIYVGMYLPQDLCIVIVKDKLYKINVMFKKRKRQIECSNNEHII